jgi:hypothetical protein
MNHTTTEDMCFGLAIRNKAEALLAAREGKDSFVDYEFVDYKGSCYLICDCCAVLSPCYIRYRSRICLPASFRIP